ncbi:YdeI/OmpD-associated family protein [Arcticibacter tournemirensis]
MMNELVKYFRPANQEEWRQWLIENHRSEESVWLIYNKKLSGVPTLSWSEAVDQALCFGWIDSTRKSLDDDTFMQFFCKRKRNSVWSKINKIKVVRLIKENLMTQAGFECVEAARLNGSWSILDSVEETRIPTDLAEAFKMYRGSKPFFLRLSKSMRKRILQWLVLAKRPETRQKRIIEVAEKAGQKSLPKQFLV